MKQVMILVLASLIAISSAVWADSARADNSGRANLQKELSDAKKECKKRCQNIEKYCAQWADKEQIKCRKWATKPGKGTRCCD